MKNIILGVLMVAGLQLGAQSEFVEVTYNTSYSTHSFFNLQNDTELVFVNDEWDIALTALGAADAGIHINEAVSFMGTELELYAAPSNVFEDEIDPVDLTDRVYNEEKSWENGAFNNLKDPNNPLDYGWGTYNPVSHSVVGDRVYAIKLRNGSFKKFMVTSLSDGTYNMMWADLDGANMQTAAVNKKDYADSDLILFSIEDNEVVEGIEPFDLLFTRYVTPLPDGQGDTLNYVVTGVLSGVGIEVAQASDVDVENVLFEDHQSMLSTELDIIGQDWKNFNLSAFSWEIVDSLAFFVIDQDKTIWKLVFLDFEGSSTGNIVFTKENVGTLTNVQDLTLVNGMEVYPNPTSGPMTVIMDLESNVNGQLSLLDLYGKEVWTRSVQLSPGVISLNVDRGQLPAGQYRLILSDQNGVAQLPVILK